MSLPAAYVRASRADRWTKKVCLTLGAPDVVRSIMVVDDDDAVVELLRRALVSEGYQVWEVSTGIEALDEARRRMPDVIVLELMLPDVGGLEICRALRHEMTTPILILTAKAEELDKVVALQVGADDYMTKPFSVRELVARVAALIRRSQLPVSTAQPAVDKLGGFRLDRRAHTVHLNGEEVHFAPKEFDLLSLLFLHSGRVLTRDEIIRKVWGGDFVGEHKTVDVHISWVRDKLGNQDRVPFRITTVQRLGYRLDRLE